VIRLLADANIEGHIARLVARMQSETWREFWDYLELRCLTFQDVRLARDASDAVIWGHCQQHQTYS
jgi:hypothetical protein